MAKIAHQFSYPLKSTFWRSAIDEQNHALIGELRDENTRTVSFVSVNFETGEVKTLLQEEDWWVEMSAVFGGKIYLGVFEESKAGEKKGVKCYTADEGRLLWENNEFSLLEVVDEGLFCQLNDAERYFLVDFESGNVHKEASEHDEFDIIKSPVVKVPFQYNESSVHFETIKTFMRELEGMEVVQVIDYLEHAGFIFISCYIYKDNFLSNWLFIYDDEGNKWHQDCLIEKTKGVGLDPFFLYEDKVVYTKDKTLITVFKIENE